MNKLLALISSNIAENDLIDEYNLHVHPLVLGSGKRLFPDGKRINLELIESQAVLTGVVFQRYQAVKEREVKATMMLAGSEARQGRPYSSRCQVTVKGEFA